MMATTESAKISSMSVSPDEERRLIARLRHPVAPYAHAAITPSRSPHASLVEAMPPNAGLHREETAVDDELRAGDVGGLVRRQEEVGIGDLLDAAIPSHGHRLQHAGPHLWISR